jgi:hypothetical protein
MTDLVKRLEDALREIETISDNCVNVEHYTAKDALDDLSAIRSVIKRTALKPEGEMVMVPRAMPPAVRDALGLPKFRTGPIAHVFRAAGHEIKPKCEDEQAFVLWWAMHLALKHGEDWRAHAEAELREVRSPASPASQEKGDIAEDSSCG